MTCGADHHMSNISGHLVCSIAVGKKSIRYRFEWGRGYIMLCSMINIPVPCLLLLQRGAVPPLVAMLGAEDTSLREMAAFALGRLAQNGDNQAGIVQVRHAAVVPGRACADTGAPY